MNFSNVDIIYGMGPYLGYVISGRDKQDLDEDVYIEKIDIGFDDDYYFLNHST